MKFGEFTNEPLSLWVRRLQKVPSMSRGEQKTPRGSKTFLSIYQGATVMVAMTTATLAASTGAATGVSLIWLLTGGGFLGAIVIFAIVKMIG